MYKERPCGNLFKVGTLVTMMARDLAKRLLIFVMAYLVMSTILAYIYQEDDFSTIGDTLEYEGKSVDIKVLFKEGQDEWAAQTLADAAEAIEPLTDLYGQESPHGSISIYASSLDELNNYPFDVEKGSSTINLAIDAERYDTIWALSMLWMQRTDAQLPEWVIWGHAAYAAYHALETLQHESLAEAFYTDIERRGTSYVGDQALSEIQMPDDALADDGVASYLVWKSFSIYKELYLATSIETMQRVYAAPFDSQNTEWDSARYVSMVQGTAGEQSVTEYFEDVFSSSVETELLRRRIFSYLEVAGTLLVVALVFFWAFWGSIKHRFEFIGILKERNKAIRALMRKYGSKDRILMELEAYFRKRIPEDDYAKYAQTFYEETMA